MKTYGEVVNIKKHCMLKLYAQKALYGQVVNKDGYDMKSKNKGKKFQKWKLV